MKQASVLSTLGAFSALSLFACGASVLGCGAVDDTILTRPDPPVVFRLIPDHASVAIGDTIRFVGAITGGSVTTPPSVALCETASPSVATTIRSLTGCAVIGLSAGTTNLVVMVSTGNRDTATVEVVPR